MVEADALPVEAPRRFHFNWVPGVFFRPRQIFARIGTAASGVWLTPMLILSLTTLGRVITAGWLRAQAAAAGGVTLPPEFQYYPPEQQAQFQQALAATNGPVFLYVFPALAGLISIWIGWLMVSGLLHLALTMLGGRGDTRSAINLVAWSGLVFALRDVVRMIAMLAGKQLIQSPGLSGLLGGEPSGGMAYLVTFLSLVDLYVIWHVILLAIGVRAANGLSAAKTVGGVLVTILVVMALQALLAFLTGQLGGLTIIRPFF